MTLGARGRGWLATSTLAALGATIGAATGVALTLASHFLVGLPRFPATEFFIYNATTCGILGMVLSPAIAWLALRRVPLWRAVAEPGLVGGVALACGLVSGSVTLTVLAPVAVVAAAWRLHREYRIEALRPSVQAVDSHSRLPRG
jgi:hypothetical protein